MSGKKDPFMFFEIVGVVIVLCFVIAFTGNSHTGGFYFEAKSYGGAIKGISYDSSRAFAGKAVQFDSGYSCSDLADVLTKKRIALEKQIKTYPSNDALKNEFKRISAIEKTYKGYTLGLRGYETRWKRQCITFNDFALIAGIDNAIPKDNVAFCCYE